MDKIQSELIHEAVQKVLNDVDNIKQCDTRQLSISVRTGVNNQTGLWVNASASVRLRVFAHVTEKHKVPLNTEDF